MMNRSAFIEDSSSTDRFSTDNYAEEAHHLTLLLLAAGIAAQQAPTPNPYPEHGQVIATRLGGEAVGSVGSVGTLKEWIYRVDCGDLYYDLQGGRKPSLTVGQNVIFRIERQKAYLDDGKNGKRYDIVGTGKSNQKQSP